MASVLGVGMQYILMTARGCITIEAFWKLRGAGLRRRQSLIQPGSLRRGEAMQYNLQAEQDGLGRPN